MLNSESQASSDQVRGGDDGESDGPRWVPEGPERQSRWQTMRSRGCEQEARQYTLEAIAVLAQLMQTAKSESVRLNAAEAILSRGWGRSVQAFQIDSHFAAKKLNELTEIELAQFEAQLASADVKPQIDEQMM